MEDVQSDSRVISDSEEVEHLPSLEPNVPDSGALPDRGRAHERMGEPHPADEDHALLPLTRSKVSSSRILSTEIPVKPPECSARPAIQSVTS